MGGGFCVSIMIVLASFVHTFLREKLKKVYSIWICVNPPKNRENTIARYRLTMAALKVPEAEHRVYQDLLKEQS